MASPQRFEGKVFIITGAGSGIGRATALKLVAQGALAFLTDINEAAIVKVVSEIQPQGRTFHECGDISDGSVTWGVVNTCVRRLGRLDGVFNCAGINPSAIPTENIQDDYYNNMMDVNVRGLFNMTRAAIPHMKAGGIFVNTSSICGVEGVSEFAVYCATKHAIIGFSKAIALELGPKGIRTNIIAPGYIDTPSNAAVVQGQEAMDLSARSCALKRMGNPDEIADVVCFLFSHESSYMNGAVVRIDGGMSPALNTAQ